MIEMSLANQHTFHRLLGLYFLPLPASSLKVPGIILQRKATHSGFTTTQCLRTIFNTAYCTAHHLRHQILDLSVQRISAFRNQRMDHKQQCLVGPALLSQWRVLSFSYIRYRQRLALRPKSQ